MGGKWRPKIIREREKFNVSKTQDFSKSSRLFQKQISRIEIIGKTREYVNNNCKIDTILIQDDGKTMKIFLENK